jgi:hypothetical protein
MLEARPIRAAWRLEENAARVVAARRAELERHNRTPPSDYRAYPAWREASDALRAAIAEGEALVPSWFWPLAPVRAFPERQWVWGGFYHLLFRSVFVAVPAFYLVLGIALGWRGSRRWWQGQWRRGLRGGGPERLFLGLGEDESRSR